MPVSLKNRQKLFAVDTGRIRRSLKRLLKELRCEGRDVCVLLVDDNGIREMNKRYLNVDRPTNVISFAMEEGEFGGINPQILGDIAISVETASRDASAGQLDLVEEIEFLMIHGLLHLLGYDHEEAAAEKAAEMKARERELFFFLRRCRLD